MNVMRNKKWIALVYYNMCQCCCSIYYRKVLFLSPFAQNFVPCSFVVLFKELLKITGYKSILQSIDRKILNSDVLSNGIVRWILFEFEDDYSWLERDNSFVMNRWYVSDK